MNGNCVKEKNKKLKILITFRTGGENGGPYISHKRIMGSSLKEDYEFVPLMLPPPKKMLSLKGFLELRHKIKKINPDILHFSGLQLEGFSILLIAKSAGIKNTLCAIRGSSMDAIEFKGVKRKILCWMENWTLKHSKACYGVSKFVANWQRVKKYAKNNLGYVYNMRDKAQVQIGARERMREEFGIAKEDIVIISTGRIIKDKGFEILLETIIYKKEWDNTKFLIVGDGNYRDEMEKRILELGMSKYVIFTGYRKDIKYLLNGSDIFIICTLHETLCNSVIEASDACLPVIATRTGGIPEIVQDEESGFLIEPYSVSGFYDALVLLIENKNLRIKMGKAGKKRIEEIFSEDRIAKKISNIYQNLFEN